ncbi:TPA: hypothetical protein ACKQAW_003888 [Stenotrophomonas maltophilia]
MSDLKHTPGPWSCMSESAHEGVYVDDCVHSVSKAAGRADIICLSPSHEDYELSAAMWDANARLIAAAPELLEAAMAFVAPFDDIEVVHDSDIAMARAAIAKATGVSHG